MSQGVVVHGRAALRQLAGSAVPLMLVVAAALGPGAETVAHAGVSSTLTDFAFRGSSYGSATSGNQAADSDTTALSVLGCTRYAPRSNQNFLAEAGDDAAVVLRQVSTRNHSTLADGVPAVVSQVQIASGSLADGQVTFTNLTGRVRSFHTRTGFHTTSTSRLGSLEVAGVPIDLPEGDTEVSISVPAGTVTLHQTARKVTQAYAAGAVNVLRFEADDGTVARVGRAAARIDGNTVGGLFGGAAWGSDARTGGLAALGRGALQPMPCPGTGGRVMDNSTGEAVLEVGLLGARSSSAYGEQHRNGSATGYTRAVIDRAVFGDGALRFRTIVARANVTRQPDADLIRNADGTGVGAIVINGQPAAPPPAGQPVQVAGVGSFTLKQVSRTSNGIAVTALTVRLHNGTLTDPADDTIINLGQARLKIRRG